MKTLGLGLKQVGVPERDDRQLHRQCHCTPHPEKSSSSIRIYRYDPQLGACLRSQSRDRFCVVVVVVVACVCVCVCMCFCFSVCVCLSLSLSLSLRLTARQCQRTAKRRAHAFFCLFPSHSYLVSPVSGLWQGWPNRSTSEVVGSGPIPINQFQ